MIEIPQVGFGLWKNTDEAEFNQSVNLAIKAGYRHFDTAQAYGNEQWLGNALKQAGLPRTDLFITTKIAVQHFGAKRTASSFEESLEKLQLSYVDLLLLHFPVTLLRGRSWKTLEDIHTLGKAKHIGVSNYTIKHLEELQANCQIKPAVNQVELHVFLQQPELLAYCKQHDILVEAYSPLAHGRGLDEPVLQQIGDKHGKSATQVMLRWCIEIGSVPLPKSVHAERIQKNIEILDFSLDKSDMQQLTRLNRNMRTCWDPTLVP